MKIENNGMMYFGTNAKNIADIQSHGLLPRNGAQSVPMTLSFAPYYALHKAAGKNERFALMVEIDLHKINPYKLVPSADFMEQLTRSDPLFAEVHNKLKSHNARVKWFAQRIEKFNKHAGASLAMIGNIGYAGAIPRDAITRMVQFDVYSPYVRRLLGRPEVSPLGYSLMGKYYLQMTKFAFGDELTMTGLHPRLVAQFSEVSRTGLKVL